MMQKGLTLILLVLLGTSTNAIVYRHDVQDEVFRELARAYPATCHFPDGEGTLISDQWVLTAAHVVEGIQRMIDRGEGPMVECGANRYAIRQIVIHPDFRPIIDDIALIQLAKPVSGITPAPLFQGEEKGRTITIVGRGDVGTGLTGLRTMDKINRAATNIIDGADEHWIWFDFDNPHQPDVTELEGVSGPGDSGGPAFIDIDRVSYVAGVSSHQRGDGKPGRYGAVEYYTRVQRYADWIQKTTGM